MRFAAVLRRNDIYGWRQREVEAVALAFVGVGLQHLQVGMLFHGDVGWHRGRAILVFFLLVLC